MAESLYIYNKQVAARKAKKAQQEKGGNTYVEDKRVSNTWGDEPRPASGTTAAAPVVPAITASEEGMSSVVSVAGPKPLYWSEHMDILLAKEVMTCGSDFDQVSERIINIQKNSNIFLTGSNNDDASLSVSEKLSAEVCKARWAKLDASQWCSMDGVEQENNNTNVSPANSSSTPVLHKIFVEPVDITSGVDGGKVGHGVQPTFQEMSQRAKGKMPSYLTPPVDFPSVRLSSVPSAAAAGPPAEYLNRHLIIPDEDDDDDDDVAQAVLGNSNVKDVDLEEFDALD